MNMKHCRFENTFKDLCDCKNELESNGGVDETIALVNEYEKKYVKKLVALCKFITENYND